MAMTVEQAYQILSKFHGYTGPRTKRAISQFVNARDLPVAVKNRGGLIGMQQGGATALEGQQPPGPIPDELKDFLVLSGSVIVTINFDLYEGPNNLLYPKYQGDKR